MTWNDPEWPGKLHGMTRNGREWQGIDGMVENGREWPVMARKRLEMTG